MAQALRKVFSKIIRESNRRQFGVMVFRCGYRRAGMAWQEFIRTIHAAAGQRLDM
jgi:hypothetical protein